MIKCKRFRTTTEYDKDHGTLVKNAIYHFNEWSSEEVEIVSTHVLHDDKGTCTEIVVFYKDKPEKPTYEQITGIGY